MFSFHFPVFFSVFAFLGMFFCVLELATVAPRNRAKHLTVARSPASRRESTQSQRQTMANTNQTVKGVKASNSSRASSCCLLVCVCVWVFGSKTNLPFNASWGAHYSPPFSHCLQSSQAGEKIKLLRKRKTCTIRLKYASTVASDVTGKVRKQKPEVCGHVPSVVVFPLSY